MEFHYQHEAAGVFPDAYIFQSSPRFTVNMHHPTTTIPRDFLRFLSCNTFVFGIAGYGGKELTLPTADSWQQARADLSTLKA